MNLIINAYLCDLFKIKHGYLSPLKKTFAVVLDNIIFHILYYTEPLC